MNKIEAIAKSIFDLDDSVISRSGGAHRISLQSVIDRSNFPEQLPVSTDNLADLIDHTLLKPEATAEQVIKICQEAETYHFRSVCVNPANASLAKKHLPHVDLCCVIGFPLGANSTEIKVAEASRAIADGAAEIDMVINLGALKSQNHDLVYNEILQIAAACHDRKAILKVIIETCLLNEDEKIIACLLSKKAGADFVKTSTGFSSGGATEADVKLMREVVGNKMGVKASGGVRDRETTLRMIAAGANRIGASAGIKIIG